MQLTLNGLEPGDPEISDPAERVIGLNRTVPRKSMC